MRPITAQPGFIIQDTVDLLASRQFVYADCYTIYNKDGQSIRSATIQREVRIVNPVSGEGTVQFYRVDGVKLTGLKLNISVGTDVDEQELTLDYSSVQTYMGQPFGQALAMGRFDGGIIRRDRYFAPDFKSDWVGGVPLFVGRTGAIDKIGRSTASVNVKSENILLDLPMPKNLYDAQCAHIVFDPGCKLVKSMYAEHGEAGAGGTVTRIPWSGGSSEFSGGTVQIEDGGGVLLVRTIREYTSGGLLLYEPLPFAPELGAKFVAFPGCDRTKARCTVFNNVDNWRAYPFVPVPETSY